MILGIDFETFSAADIKFGPDAYAAHESTGIHCAAWAFAERRGTQLIIVEDGVWLPGAQVPPRLRKHIADGGLVCAHNCAFEMSILRHVAHPQHKWPTVPLTSWVDTAALASLCGLPVKLSGIARALGTASQKDLVGAEVMKSLMKATRGEDGEWIAPKPTPDQLAKLTHYCLLDVRTMLEVLARLPGTTSDEHIVRHADLRVNLRGVMLDQLLAHNIAVMSKRRADELSSQIAEITAGGVPKATATPALKTWLAGQDVELAEKKRANGTKSTSVDRGAVDKLLTQGLDPRVEAVLERRVEASKATSLSKVLRVPEMVGTDGRLRHALRYCGAHTGRWSSSGLQLHNMPKVPAKAKAMLDDLRRAVCAGDYEAARLIAKPNLMQGLSWLLRSVVIAPPGKDLIGGDYSAIEARVLAWLAGQNDVLQLFASGQDVYTSDAKAIGSDNRQLGKVCRLALGYGMGAVKFRDTAASYGIDLPLKQARAIQLAWRAANPAIAKFWLDLEQACRFHAVKQGTTLVGRLRVLGTKTCVRVVLPSGRPLFYWRPRVQTVTRKLETVDEAGNLLVREMTLEEFQFFSPGPDKEHMVAEGSYGGKLVENVTQAVARELMAFAIVRMQPTIYEVVLHVHDSIAAEVDEGRGSVEEFSRLMMDNPGWAEDLPMAVDSYRAKSFKG